MRKIIRFAVFLYVLLMSLYYAINGNLELELICLFLSYANYKNLEGE